MTIMKKLDTPTPRVRKRVFLVFVATCAWAQSGLDRPQMGMMLDSSGAARPVLGLPGSISLADPAAASVVSLGCSASCLIKTDSSLVAPDSTTAAPPGPALFAFDASGAFVYFAQSKQLARWQGGQLTPVDYEVAGDILSIRSVNGAPEFAVRRGDGIDIVGVGNTIVDSLPRSARAVMLFDGGVLYSTREEVILRRADASELRFPLTGARSFVAMAADYIEIRAAASTFALRLTPGREKFFLLPETPQ
jgi:hypothetical protein